MSDTATTLVCVSTFRRPEQLNRFLTSVVSQLDASRALLVVIDNDPDASARAVVDSLLGPLIYEHEPKPGIAATRNRALDVAITRDAEFVIFVDDDEWASDAWLSEMVKAARQSPAGVISGPVVTEYSDQLPRWIERYGFFQRTPLPHGARPSSAATNNTLLKMRAWRDAGSPRFDDSYSETGGSDTDFFSRLHRSGTVIEFTRKPVVFEDVPNDRATFRWLTKRGVRNGIVQARVRSSYRHRAAIVVAGIARLFAGIAFSFIALIGRPSKVADSYATFLRGVGLIAGATSGFRIREYSRDKTRP